MATHDDWLKITINGETFTLDSHVPPTTTLLQYIRDFARLPGTKASCNEGGCGTCTVVATIQDLEKDKLKTFSLQACQKLVFACNGWSIFTIEHLGNRHNGYNILQNSLHKFYGSQCGYCTPGFVMTMYGQMNSSSNLKVEQIEKAMDGNICRCTGYRPILEAFKCFGTDASKDLTAKLKDIEEAHATKCSKNSSRGEPCSQKCDRRLKELSFEKEGTNWYRPRSVQDVYDVIGQTNLSSKIRLVVGNTGQGVFKNEGPYDIYVDMTGVKELFKVESGAERMLIGANVSLQRCIEVFLAATSEKGYRHLSEVAKHWQKIAHVGVRNVGSWAGNLMMKKYHHEFCSDVFICFVAIGARINVGRSNGHVLNLTPEELLTTDMSKSIILSMEIPPQPQNTVLRTYKITPRASNAHAYVNACFKFLVTTRDHPHLKVAGRPELVFGGIRPSFIHAAKTEHFLTEQSLSDSDNLKKAIQILGEELYPDSNPEDASPEFRKSLAQCLLYKTFLFLLNKATSPELRSGGVLCERPVSCSKQSFDANKELWPVGQAMPKLESRRQIAGEAEFLDDIPLLPDELFGSFVQSTIARGKIKSMDASECLKLADVVDFIKADDIPGENTFYGAPNSDPVFVAGNEIKYAGQAIGLVVAKSKLAAEEGAKLVKVIYNEVQKPILSIREAIEGNRSEKAQNFLTSSTDPFAFGDIEDGFRNSKHVVEGEVEFGGQFHFSLEPIATRVVPTEDGYDIYCTSQWPTMTQAVVANNLGIPANRLNMATRRLGGAFGGKITRPNIVASAAAIAAYKLNKPVRITLDLSTQMTLVGGREPYLSKYKVGFNEDGRFSSISVDIYGDVGHVANEAASFLAAESIPSIYHCPNWRVQGHIATTDTPANTWCRSPGHVNAVATMENLIERVADYLNKDPMEIREINFICKEKPQSFGNRRENNVVKSKILPLLKSDADIANRKKAVMEFNQDNRWKKKGLSVIPLRFSLESIPFFQYNVQVVIYEHDGSVAITHGGIEMGQGINTKVAQVAAKFLGVPVDLIIIKQSDLFAGANSSVTAGSRGTDLVSYGVMICCQRIRKRMNEVAKTMNENVSWHELVKKCFMEEVDICERYFTFHKDNPPGYDVWAAACLEVELDVLTGQFLILRADIIEDCGKSMNPYIDVGQIEGAFVMGLGLYTTEEIKFNKETGQKLSNGTWDYKPPSALDIPVDFRVSLLHEGENPYGVLGSKATGEPAVCLGYVIVSALRKAITAARKDAGNTQWFEIDTPLTVEQIHQLCNIDPTEFSF